MYCLVIFGGLKRHLSERFLCFPHTERLRLSTASFKCSFLSQVWLNGVRTCGRAHPSEAWTYTLHFKPCNPTCVLTACHSVVSWSVIYCLLHHPPFFQRLERHFSRPHRFKARFSRAKHLSHSSTGSAKAMAISLPRVVW